MDSLFPHAENGKSSSELRLLAPHESLCGKCGQIKPKSDFYKNTSKHIGRHHWCKECVKAYNREKNAKDPEVNLNKQLWYNYGITREEYDALWKEQGGRCACCGKEETTVTYGKVRKLSVDHCHTTMAVRGLLCADCNTALGHLREDPERVKSLLKYIEERCLW